MAPRVEKVYKIALERVQELKLLNPEIGSREEVELCQLVEFISSYEEIRDPSLFKENYHRDKEP